MTAAAVLSMYVIYDHPADHPDEFVARRWDVGATGPIPKELVGSAKTLEEVRELLPPDLAMIPRMPGDDPKIVEVWL